MANGDDGRGFASGAQITAQNRQQKYCRVLSLAALTQSQRQSIDTAALAVGDARFQLKCHRALDAFRAAGVNARVQSALRIDQVVEPYIRGKAIRYLEEGRVVVFGAGTGNPFFTTDTAAALRGAEIGADIVLKATKVDGIYTADPKKDPAATRFQRISFDEAIARNLAVMDATAFALCRDQRLPINVFSLFKSGALKRVVMGEDEGTLVYC